MGRVEVDECYLGGLEESLPGRLNLEKALVVVAAQEDGPGIGRIQSRSRGKLFFRLVQQALAVGPVPLDGILHPATNAKVKPTTCRGYLSQADTHLGIL
jgi:hypothetical protein